MFSFVFEGSMKARSLLCPVDLVCARSQRSKAASGNGAAKPPSKKKSKKDKDKDAPKKNMSGFMLFSQAKRAEVRCRQLEDLRGCLPESRRPRPRKCRDHGLCAVAASCCGLTQFHPGNSSNCRTVHDGHYL